MVGSPSGLMFTIIKQLLLKIFKPSYKIRLYEKNSTTIGVINCCNKAQHWFSNLPLKRYRPIKVKVYLLKNALNSVSEKVKGVNVIKQIKSIWTS